MNNRFPKAYRLTKRKEIQAVFARRDIFRGQRLLFYRGPVLGGELTEEKSDSQKNQIPEPKTGSPSSKRKTDFLSRYCLMVAKKCGTAIRRNRIKRVLREIIRQHQDRIPPGYDYVIRVACDRLNGTQTITEKDFIGDFKTYFGWE